MPCLDDDTIIAFAQGDTLGEERAAVESHLKDCAGCSLLVAEAARSQHPDPGGEAGSGASLEPLEPAGPSFALRLEAGAEVGRYLVRRHIARGGGGDVYEAHDPQLKRRVALKLLAVPDAPAENREAIQARLLREAETMAGISHPNIVHVYDAAAAQGRVFIVTEFVEGETLTRWLRRGKRSWREILPAFRAAAEGLVAIHETGLVHGDFKPDNVLVGRDGHFRITDFGLARPAAAGAPRTGSGGGHGPGTEGVTAAGGTPLFMAPEQARGEPPTALSDQYSFCVSLYLALLGRHPSSDAVAEGGRASARHVPAVIMALLRRGLAARPPDRHSSMRVLSSALGAAAGAGSPAAVAHAAIGLGVAVAARLATAGKKKLPALARAAIGLGACAAGLGAVVTLLAAPPAACGNGSTEEGEECDDGDTDDTDSCTSDCRRARCGDAKVWRTVEECDDGNKDNHDGCTASCAMCGQGDRTRWAASDTGTCHVLQPAPADWISATAICASQGQILSTFRKPPEAKEVARAFAGRSLWMGLNWRSSDKSYRWVTDEPVDPQISREWEAPDAPGAAICVYHTYAPTTGSGSEGEPAPWLRGHCLQSLDFSCETTSSRIDPRTGHAYRIYYDAQTWPSARIECARRGSHLATITSAEEQAFVGVQARGEAWIGATDAQEEGRFAWITGEAFVFRTFVPGELDDARMGGANDCVVFGADGLWHDRRCGFRLPYLCEIDP